MSMRSLWLFPASCKYFSSRFPDACFIFLLFRLFGCSTAVVFGANIKTTVVHWFEPRRPRHDPPPPRHDEENPEERKSPSHLELMANPRLSSLALSRGAISVSGGPVCPLIRGDSPFAARRSLRIAVLPTVHYYS